MTPAAFRRELLPDLPIATLYYRLRLLAERNQLPANVATPRDSGKYSFDLPNPATQPNAAQVIVNLIEQASRWPKGETDGTI